MDQFAVVRFIEDDTVSEVPTIWLSGENKFCWWPPVKNVTLYIQKKVPPDEETWSRHQIELEKLCKTLESARKRAEDDTYTSSDESRRKIKRKRFNDEWLQDSDSESTFSKQKRMTTSPPVLISEDTPVVLLDYTDCIEQGNEERIKSVQEDRSECTSEATTVTLNSSVSENSLVMLNCILKTITEVKLQVQAISQKLLTFQGRRETTNPENPLAKHLPLNTFENLEEFENFLADEENKKIFQGYISTVGGNGPKDHIVRSLVRVFGDRLAVLCSWQGQRGNFRVCDLKSMMSMKEVVVSSHLLRENEFETIGAEWFRQARQRILRKKAKIQSCDHITQESTTE